MQRNVRGFLARRRVANLRAKESEMERWLRLISANSYRYPAWYRNSHAGTAAIGSDTQHPAFTNSMKLRLLTAIKKEEKTIGLFSMFSAAASLSDGGGQTVSVFSPEADFASVVLQVVSNLICLFAASHAH